MDRSCSRLCTAACLARAGFGIRSVTMRSRLLCMEACTKGDVTLQLSLSCNFQRIYHAFVINVGNFVRKKICPGQESCRKTHKDDWCIWLFRSNTPDLRRRAVA